MSSSDESTTTVKELGTPVRAKLPVMTSLEKEILLGIVAIPKFKCIVENKSTNSIWTAQKDEAWAKISLEFCSQLNVTKRSGPKLKKSWENLKSRAKKQVSKTKRSRGKTGGGKNKYEISPVSAKVVSIVPAQLASISNPYDDDAVTSEEEAGRKSIQESSKTLEREVISSILAGNRSDIGQVQRNSARAA
ncbi:myb/SANT-like DNA-binding domain-containing protein 3 [Folsomia candida]|uniref:Regulatory protein zeste n=1 Tax=Folsomia candida TaxID=158441 RepID=A0A226DMH4_FOLCA|nr:myb/SANT-like DNA-binding domain-containing protein 3 [Folsomia candida]OXA46389.1 Myb/SANT-like DNA-binding domain-containing protein 3 [Folsomia candida]